MILERLVLRNLFSYCGEHVLELLPPSDGRNIVLIQGRNGQGKTSLLNALKLLIGGVTDDLRSSALSGRTLTAHQYVLGAQEDWLGIFNSRALKMGELKAAVEGIFLHAGRKIQVQRTWEKTVQTPGYEARAHIRFLDLGDRVDVDATEFLEERFPPEFVPYFLFDGELVQRMAEDSTVLKHEAVSALLELRPYELLDKNLSELEREARRSSGDEALLEELSRARTKQTQLTTELEVKETQLRKRKQEHQRAADVLQDLETKLAGLHVEQNGPQGVATLEQRRTLEGHIQTLQEQVLLALRAGPSAFATELRRSAEQQLNELARHNTDKIEAQTELLDRLIQLAPAFIFKSSKGPYPPPASHIPEFYQKRLLELLESERPELNTGGLQLTPAQRTLLRERLQALSAIPTSTQVRPFRELVQARRELARVIDSLEHMGSRREDERLQQAALKREQQTRWTEQGRLEQEISTLEQTLRSHRLQLASHQRTLEQLTVANEHLLLEQKKAVILYTLQRFIADYLKLCQESRRRQIEEGVTRHFLQLFDSNRLIDRIRVNSSLGLSLENSRNIPVARGSISAGMKQLVAISLLWTLMELSARKALVAIDTPLARLDRAHQAKVLQVYLPAVSTQVLLLPTDSELTPDKYAQLKPYVYKEFTLVNESGDDTKIREISHTRG